MQLKLLLETLDRLEEGTRMKAVKAAVEMEPDAGRRAMILAKLARENDLPGLYDPTDGVYYNVNGEKERSPDNAITQKLGSLGLVPMNAQTSMFGLWGADDVKQSAISHSFDLNWAEEVNDNIKRLNDLVKQISVNLKESKKRKKSISNSLYESFFGLEEDSPPYSPPTASGNNFAKEIEEMNKIIEVLTALNEKRPNEGIVAAIQRAQDVIKRVSAVPPPVADKPPVTPPVADKPPVTPAKPGIDWSGVTEKEPLTYKPPAPSVTPQIGPSTTPSTDPRIEKIKKARELLNKVKVPLPEPVTPQTNPNQPPKPGEDKKWPTTDEEIKAFQKSKPPLEVDGLIGSRTFKALVAAGYTPPPGFKPVSDKQKGTTPNPPKRSNGLGNDDATGTGDAIERNLANNLRDAGDNAERNAAWNDSHNAAMAALDPNAPNPVTPQTGPTSTPGRRPDLALGPAFDPRAQFTPADLERIRKAQARSFGEFDRGSGNTWEESIESSEDNRILDQIKNVRF